MGNVTTMDLSKILVILILLNIKYCQSILNDYNYSCAAELINRREFHCQWNGGGAASLTCKCEDYAQELNLKQDCLPYELTAITIQNCKAVNFEPNSVTNLQNLRIIHLINSVVTFQEDSINWYGYKSHNDMPFEEEFDLSIPSLKVLVENSTIPKISSHSFRGRIKEITFRDVRINEISSFAFTNLLQTENIQLINVVLDDVKLQAFKQFVAENLILKSVEAPILPSRTFSNVKIYNDLIIDGCKFNIVRPGAFIISHPDNFHVINNKVFQLDGEAFKIAARGDIQFKNNDFKNVNDGAFMGITALEENRQDNLQIIFNNNIFTNTTRNSLSTQLKAKFFDLNINEECNCKNIAHKIKNEESFSEIRCIYEDQYVPVAEFEQNKCSIITNYASPLIISAVVLVLLLLIAGVLVYYYKKVHKSRQYGSKNAKNVNNLSMIVPDGRTYRETEVHVIVERAELLTTDL